MFTIVSAVAHQVALPLKEDFTTGWGTLTHRPTIIVQLDADDGRTGWGEAAALPDPLYLEEFSDSSFLALTNYLLPSLPGRSGSSVDDFMAFLPSLRGHRFALAGVEEALWDLQAQQQESSLATCLGGLRQRVQIGETVGVKKSIAHLINEIEARVADGYSAIKLKVRPGWDLEPIGAARAMFPDLLLSVDCNASYDFGDLTIFNRLDQQNLVMIEQPLRAGDLWEHSKLQRMLATPICLDESIRCAADAKAALEMDATRIINIKQGRVGGLREAVQIHDMCHAADIPVWSGGMIESGIGRAASIAVASLPGFTLPSEISENQLFYSRDLIDPTYAVTDGYLEVPTSPGLGFAIDATALKEMTVQVSSFQAKHGGSVRRRHVTS